MFTMTTLTMQVGALVAAHLSANPYKYGLCPKCGGAELRAAADGEPRGIAVARREEAVHQPLRERQPVGGGERDEQPHF